MLEYKQQTIGNFGGYLACKGVTYENMRVEMEALVADIADSLSRDYQEQPLLKSYLRARDRWRS